MVARPSKLLALGYARLLYQMRIRVRAIWWACFVIAGPVRRCLTSDHRQKEYEPAEVLETGVL